MGTSATTSLNRAAHLASEHRKIVESSDQARARRDDAIWQAFVAGYTMRQIARSVGLSHTGVVNVIRAREAAEEAAAKGARGTRR
jgi:FixJ family two-component response regulator